MKTKQVRKNLAEKQSVSLERQTYTVEEAAKILGICRAVAYRRGVLPTVRVAGRRLVPKQALERMLAETV
jgi:excisionase family DNA binding protein